MFPDCSASERCLLLQDLHSSNVPRVQQVPYLHNHCAFPHPCPWNIIATRSTAFCEELSTVREQINGITAFVDASNVCVVSSIWNSISGFVWEFAKGTARMAKLALCCEAVLMGSCWPTRTPPLITGDIVIARNAPFLEQGDVARDWSWEFV